MARHQFNESQVQRPLASSAVAKAIARFETYTKWRDFKKFHVVVTR
jgi:hypothetical protein